MATRADPRLSLSLSHTHTIGMLWTAMTSYLLGFGRVEAGHLPTRPGLWRSYCCRAVLSVRHHSIIHLSIHHHRRRHRRRRHHSPECMVLQAQGSAGIPTSATSTLLESVLYCICRRACAFANGHRVDLPPRIYIVCLYPSTRDVSLRPQDSCLDLSSGKTSQSRTQVAWTQGREGRDESSSLAS